MIKCEEWKGNNNCLNAQEIGEYIHLSKKPVDSKEFKVSYVD